MIRKYERDGFYMQLSADDQSGAWVSISNGTDHVSVPWKVMADLCGVISRWDTATKTVLRDINGTMVKVMVFDD